MQTLVKAGFAEQTVNKSRFIAAASYCETEREVGAFLRALAAQHQYAHHLAYGFRIKTADGIIPRFSDSGEPSGTAGKPILQMLEGRDLMNVAVGVIRYYGGINLGTGGLVRAYSGTAKMALDAPTIAPFIEMQQISLSINYKQVDELTRVLAKLNGQVLEKTFDEAAHFVVKLPAIKVQAFVQQFKKQSAN
ncbi:MAG: YigZ family protein [Bdellovibrio sp.]|nr:YigZ family protein [Methylotenera sp.]